MADFNETVERLRNAWKSIDSIDHESDIDCIFDAVELLEKQNEEIKQLKRYINEFSCNAVPVVRCSECRWNSGSKHNPFCQQEGVAHYNGYFCADGERRN